MADEFAWMDLVAQAELVRTGEVTPEDLVEAAIARIERLNPELNAVITPMYDLARAAAAQVDRAAPLAGAPYLLKDLVAEYAGVPMSEGSAFLAGFVPDHDSELVRRLKQSGLIILGKTNTPEFGQTGTTEPKFHGPTRNPWDPERTPGGSSGGSAAAVASGMVASAHANDGGGSIRIPAAWCGVFGLKPTRARNPLGPGLGDALGGLAEEHAVTRSVRDSAALLDATSGPDLGDPYWAPPPARPFRDEVGADPGRLRIAFTRTALNGEPTHPDAVAAIEDTARLCEELGHEVVEATPPLERRIITRGFSLLWNAACTWAVEDCKRRTGREPTPDQLEPATWAAYESGKRTAAADYLLARQDGQRLARDLARFMVDYDAWLLPVLGGPAVPLGSFDGTDDDPLAGIRSMLPVTAFTPLANVTGQPAMSAPLYWTPDGLPVGSQFVGRFGDEATLFRLAGQLEQARPWADRRPKIAA